MRLVAIIVLTLFSGEAALAQEFLYPKKGQSQEQQDKDKYECHTWAVAQTGFDPMSASAATVVTPEVASAPPPSQKGGAVRGDPDNLHGEHEGLSESEMEDLANYVLSL